MTKKRYNYAKKITQKCRNITKQEEQWINLCDKNGRSYWIQWRGKKPIFCSCDIGDGCDYQEFDKIDKAIEWELGYN